MVIRREPAFHDPDDSLLQEFRLERTAVEENGIGSGQIGAGLACLFTQLPDAGLMFSEERGKVAGHGSVLHIGQPPLLQAQP